MRLLPILLAAAVTAACGPVKDPFRGLTPGGACARDTDCAVGDCPDACNRGQPYCQYPAVYLRADVERVCPCAKTPGAASCATPAPESCGPLPGCIQPEGADTVQAKCVGGQCSARFPDGGVVPPPVP